STRVSCGLIHFGGSTVFPTYQLQHSPRPFPTILGETQQIALVQSMADVRLAPQSAAVGTSGYVSRRPTAVIGLRSLAIQREPLIEDFQDWLILGGVRYVNPLVRAPIIIDFPTSCGFASTFP